VDLRPRRVWLSGSGRPLGPAPGRSLQRADRSTESAAAPWIWKYSMRRVCSPGSNSRTCSSRRGAWSVQSSRTGSPSTRTLTPSSEFTVRA